MQLAYQVFIGILIAAFSCLFTYFIASKSTEKRFSEMEKKIADGIEKHKGECGARLNGVISGFDVKLQKMELRQVKIDMKTNLLLSFVEQMAKKMEITIDINSLTKGESNE